jgi:uncharacterized membrane protein
MKTIKYYKFRLFLIRFLIIGMMGYIFEVFFTGSVNLVKSIYAAITEGVPFDFVKAVTGYTGIFGFFIYCWAAIPFTFLTNPLKKCIKNDFLLPKLGIILRGVIYGLVFMGIEFAGGLLLLWLFNMRSWDYSHLPLNIMGIITFLYLPLWTFAGIVGEWIHDRLVKIDDILLNPEGYTDEGIKKGFDRYQEHMKQKKT